MSSATTKRTKNEVQLDDATVAAKIQNYPPETHEPIMWLAGCMRERCSGRYDILLERVRKLGFKRTTENYFYRVLTGRYFQMKDGEVAGSSANLLEIIDKLRAGVLLASRAGKMPFILTGTYHRIAGLIDSRRAPGAVCKFGVIIGPTGGQKTESVKHYCELNNHGRCIHIEAPDTPTLGTFLTDLCDRYGGSRGANHATKRLKITECVNDQRMIAVDNVQRLYRPGQRGNQPIFNFLQKLQDDTGCAIVLMFAEDRAKFLTSGLEEGYFEQFEGRAGGRENFLVLDTWTPRSDLIEIAAAYDLPTNAECIDYLAKLSQRPGRIRILFDALQQAHQEARARSVPMSVELIREVRGEVGK